MSKSQYISPSLLNTSPISHPLPSAVTYHIPTSPFPSSRTSTSTTTKSPLKTTICLPQNSTWTSGLHFHTYHTEYLRLVRGAVSVRLGSKTTLRSHTDNETDQAPVILVPRGVKHEWMRADAYLALHKHTTSSPLPGTENIDAKVLAEPVVVEEWTDPSDIEKALFFWNLNGVIMNAADVERSVLRRGMKSMLGDWWVPFQLFVVFWELDNYPVFFEVGGVRGGGLMDSLGFVVEYFVSYLVLFASSLLARLIGVEAVSEERTPKDLWEARTRDGTVERQLD